MTARISLNLGRTGGHRPPLQSEHFLPLGKAPPLQGGECNVPLAKGDGREAAGGAQFPILIPVESNPSLCLSRGAGSRVPPRRVWLFLVLICLDVRLLQVLRIID